MVLMSMEETIRWSLGFIAGAGWSAINIISTINILKIGVLKKDPARLYALVLLKFPLLYLAGFWLLSSGVFPGQSLLTGLTVVLILSGTYKIWSSLTQRQPRSFRTS